jgi:NhaA family Na+:H+ antiporter
MKYVLRRPISLIAEFLRLESAAGLLLMAAAALALVLANSPAAPVYHAALAATMGLPGASLSLLHWINDGLMANFFCWSGWKSNANCWWGNCRPSNVRLCPALPRSGAWWCLP